MIRDVVFDPVDAGGLRVARYGEPFALLVGQLAYEGSKGPRSRTDWSISGNCYRARNATAVATQQSSFLPSGRFPPGVYVPGGAPGASSVTSV